MEVVSHRAQHRSGSAAITRHRTSPVKRTPDTRPMFAQFGAEECWELDALSPTVINDLIRTEIEAMIDTSKWRKREAAEQRNRALLDRVSENWAKVKKAVVR